MSRQQPKRMLWCDAEANCHRLATREGVAAVVEKARRADIDTLIVDVKPLGGEVLYNSKLAPRLGEVGGREFPKSFDLLATMLEEAHPRGIAVHAAVNVFSEGHRDWGRGPAYEHPDWQVVMYEALRTVRLENGPYIEVAAADPRNTPDGPMVYTCKSGKSHTLEAGVSCIAIRGDFVEAVFQESGVEITVPEDGCLLFVPGPFQAAVEPGHRVTWHATPVFRTAAESQQPSWGIFVNPIGPARDYELRVIKEIASTYEIDGITFDRMRYSNLYGDFSETSRAAFESWLEQKVGDWPEGVFRINEKPWLPVVPGKFFKEWLEWRAWQIHDFAEDAGGLARAARPRVDVGVYVGSWYESYYDVGVNWGNPSFHPGYWWMTDGYNRTGFAGIFDYICTGCYYPIVTRCEARAKGLPEGATVEAACQLSRQAVGDASHVYGSLYLRDYESDSDAFRRALDVTQANTDGIMLFDLIYLEDYGWWPILEEIFAERSPDS